MNDDQKKLLAALGLDDLTGLADKAIDELADCAEQWDGDSSNDRLARAMIGSVRPVIEAMTGTDEDPPNRMIQVLTIQHLMAAMKTIESLRTLADLRKS